VRNGSSGPRLREGSHETGTPGGNCVSDVTCPPFAQNLL
jgi:hypothetical protein